MNASVQAGIAGALVTLVLIAGFIALDKGALHWYADSGDDDNPSPSVATAVFTDKEVESLTEFAIEDGAFKLPQGTQFANCVSAEFRPANDRWIVTCEFRANRSDAQPLQTRIFVFNDGEGRVEASPN